MSGRAPIHFGPFTADPTAGELRNGGTRIKLQDQPFRILLCLLERPGEVVTREELVEKVWPKGTFVEFEHSLNTSINKLRRALNDSADRPRYIETIPRRGYRFVGMFEGLTPRPKGWRVSPRLWAGAGLVAVALALVFLAAGKLEIASRVAEAPRRYVIPTDFRMDPNWNRALISPDGRRVAYSTGGSPRTSAVTLWVQDLQRDEPRRIAGPGRLSLVAWSPDGRQLAYMQGSTLLRVPVEGGRPVPITTVEFGSHAQGGSWSPDGRRIILVPPFGVRRLAEVTVDGGEVRTVLSPESDDSVSQYRSVHYLPGPGGARRIVYEELRDTTHRILTTDLDTGLREALADGRQPFYSRSGHLLYQAPDGLRALPFSAKKLISTGDPVPVRRGGWSPSVSLDGTLVYMEQSGGLQQLVWKDRRGVELGTIGQPQAQIFHPALSPGGDRVAVGAGVEPDLGEEAGTLSIWVHEVARPTRNRITFGLWANVPAWKPNGIRIAYSAVAGGSVNIFLISADGNGKRITLLDSPYPKFPYSWSSDGRYLLFERSTGLADIWRLEVDEDGNPVEETPIVETTEFDEISPVLSPDNRLLAYASDKSGRHEVYVRTFPEGDRDWLVSTNGGKQPRWRGDGRELYYVDDEGSLFAVPVTLSPEFSPGEPECLFSHPETLVKRGPQYDVTPDGQRFLVVKVLKEPKSVIRVVENWFTELREIDN